ncbi:MAG TPA: M28 family peptidase [Candidatus Solibacter sp.]|nr:M28 family peptidase [Candidatus Solibacter sp.]
MCICLFIAPTASSETIHYRTLPSPVIEKRLAAFGKTNAARQEILRGLFTEAGCVGSHITDQSVKEAKVPNLICILPGEMEATIITGAHFDFVNEGKGVVDNWSGASMLPSLFESLKSVPRRHTFVFIGFTDEEKGLVGSKSYLKQLGKEDQRKISAMVNLDSLGTSTTKLETDRGDKRLAGALAAVAATFKLPISVVNAHNVGRSDSDSFQDKKIPTINLHSMTNETIRIIHSPRDQMEAVHMDEYYDSYRLIAAYLAYLDVKFDPASAP